MVGLLRVWRTVSPAVLRLLPHDTVHLERGTLSLKMLKSEQDFDNNYCNVVTTVLTTACLWRFSGEEYDLCTVGTAVDM